MGPFKVLTFLVWMGLGVLVYAVLAVEYNRILIFKEPAPNKVLEGHVVRTEKVTDDGSCRVKCYMEPNCVSINVGPQDEGTHMCELNKATDESQSQSALVGRQRYTYYGVENPCHSNPCPELRDVCQVGFTDKGFRCVCRESYKDKQCGKDCQEALGMESGSICDGQITASSQYSAFHTAVQGRLHFQAAGSLRGAWSAATEDANQWLQVYLGSEAIVITRVATQGRNGDNYQWVTKYNLQYSDDIVNFRFYREQGKTQSKDFAGNRDRDTVVVHELNPPIRARYIRFRPVAWRGWISMRVELYGCSKVCPSYWTPFGTSRFAVFSLRKVWKHGEAFCNAMDARLAKIDSQAETAFINTIVAKMTSDSRIHWIGLNDTDMSIGRDWKWSDGSPLGIYNNWGHGQPDNRQSRQDCVALFGIKWHDLGCGWKEKFICEKN